MYSSLQPVAIEEAPPVFITTPPAPATFSAPPKALVADATYRADLEQTLLERLGSLDRVPAVRVAPRDLAKLGIDHRAGFVLSMIDGMTPIEMLIDLSGLPRVDVLRILDELVQAGAVALQ